MKGLTIGARMSIQINFRSGMDVLTSKLIHTTGNDLSIHHTYNQKIREKELFFKQQLKGKFFKLRNIHENLHQ